MKKKIVSVALLIAMCLIGGICAPHAVIWIFISVCCGFFAGVIYDIPLPLTDIEVSPVVEEPKVETPVVEEVKTPSPKKRRRKKPAAKA